ncbi:MAG: hypothetical protein IJZ64_04795, partial [Ruminococcus sp.]|nr:hypothetical protein [Ruminococcus sp.]
MVENNALRNAVDVIGLHHTTYGDSYTNLLNEAYGKEIWYSEGAAPCNCSDLTVEADQSGIAGKNGAIDIANRIINSYYNGKMTMYEFQPAVAACYDGSTDMPKYLIKASEPWSGYYKLESGFWMAMHFSRFSPKGWMFVNGACYGDGEENQSITDTTNNFMTLVSPDRAEMTMHFTNEDLVPRTYSVIVKDMAFENRTLSAIITTGPNPGQPYNANWFRCAKPVRPSHRNEETYFVKVPPQSILTLTTLDTSWVNGVETFSHTSPNSERLPLPYIDDFNYPKEEIMIRGCAPRYTTDQGGAFELIRAEKDKNVVCQRVVSSKVPLNSKLRGTPNPITTVGDDKWRSYSAEIDVKLDNCNQDNYAGFGIRYNSSSTCENSARCGYIGLLYGNGEWKLMDMDEVAAEGQLQNIQTNQWNNLKLLVLGNSILFFINGNLMTTYRPQCMINSGRVSFCSAYEMNTFSNLKVTPMPILPLYVRRVDCFSDSIFYNEYWDICQEEKYTFYNRTAMRANKNAAFSCAFTGTGISVIGTARNAEFRVMIDDTILYESLFIPYCFPRQACLVVDQLKDNIVHTIEMTLLSGDFKLDVIEIPENHILMPDILEVTSAAEAAAKEHENMIRRQRQAEKNAEQKANETLERAVEALNDIQVDTSDEDEYIEDNENTKIIKEIISSGQIHDEVIADFVKVVKPEKSKNDNRFEEDKEVSDDVQSEQQDDMPLYGEPEEENVYEEKEPATEPRYKGFLRKLLSSQPKEIDNRETEIQQPVLESEVEEPIPEIYEQQYVQPQRTPVQREQRVVREPMPEAYEQQYVQPQRTLVQREQRIAREQMPEAYEQQYVQPQRTPIQREQRVVRESMPETYEQQ